MRTLSRRVSVAFVGLLSASSLTALGQAPKWALDGAAFSETPAAIQVAAAAVKAEPLMDVTVLFEQERYVLSADGRTVQTHQTVYRIEDKEGVEEWNQTSVEWDPWYQERPSIKARVIGTDGKVSELDAKTLTDVPAKNESEDTFSDERIYKGPLPGVAVGSIVEEETVVTDKSPFFAGGGIYRTYFSRGVPVVRSRLVVVAPDGVELKTKTHGLPESAVAKIEMAGLSKIYSYDLSPVPMSLNSDIALATDKPRSTFVEFATGASWGSVASAYRQLSDSQIQPDQVKSLVAGLPTGDSMATIAALVAKLHKEIRYTGIEFGESGLKPQTPGEVLKRHYGDCKDKAALLVGMLRASGIPAELALLSTGPGYDVGAELAGMNQFNHAIVHVPAGKNGRAELWIDATAEFTKVGDLPYGDQGRMALLIAEGTTGLTLIPEAKSTDSVDVETREFELKQFGPARVVETSMTTGHIDADYRYRYGGTETKATKEDLENYAKRFYSAKALTRTEHTDGSDLTKPFVLKLEMDKAARGTSEIGGAAVGIPPAGTMSMLPRWFFVDPEVDETKLTAEEKSDREKAKKERTDEYEVQPYVSEVRYRVTVPEGFVSRALPEEQTLHMGPAVLTRHFAEETVAGKKVVTALIRFDTGKPRYTTDEVLALRKAAVEQNKLQYILLQFDQVGAKAIAEGKVREGLAADRALIAAHPSGSSEDVAMHHVQLSSALLGVGLGEEAQKEARRATELDPKLQIAWLQLGISLEHNDIGVRFGKGFDRKGALEAYRKAKTLDAENIYPTVDIAVLSEYNGDGDRYAEGSDLAEAVKEYRALKTVDPNSAESYEDSLLFALMYDKKYLDVIAELKTLPMSPTRDAMAVAATAAAGNNGEGDVAAGLKRADLVAGGDEQKSAALRLAGLELIRLERYPLAAEMLKAATAGQADSPQLQQQIAIFSNLKHADTAPLPATDPKAPAHLMMSSMMTGTMTKELSNFLDRNAYASEKEWQLNVKHNEGASGMMRTMATQAQLPMAVMRDVVLSNAKFNATGDDAKGHRVTMTALGAAPQSLFVTKDDGQYRIVASGTDYAEVGNYAVYLLAHGRETEARNLLDWKRELVHKGGGDDPLDGPLFPRFWTTGSSSTANAGADAIRIAALALTVSKPTSHLPIEPALAALKGAPGNGYAVADLELLLADAYINKGEFKTAEMYTDKLLKEYPDSTMAIGTAGRVYLGAGEYKAWNSLLKARMDAKPGDRDLLEQAAEEAEAEQDYDRARADLQQIVDAGKATSNDYNSFGWLGLFDGKLDQKTTEAAQQANQLTKSANFGVLHTLACVYAAEGKTAEARQLLLAAMATQNQSEPSEEVWFGLGLTYEQFGEKQAAIAAYKRVEKPEGSVSNPVETYVLAQKHLKGLGE